MIGDMEMSSETITDAARTISSRSLEDEKQYAKKHLRVADLDSCFVSGMGGRSENQDCFGYIATDDGTQVFCVADGLGGHAGGRVASQIAVQTVIDFTSTSDFKFEDPLSLATMFKLANEEIVKAQQNNTAISSMRSTLIVLMIKDSLAFWAHVGDVRLYMVRNNQILAQTKDHSIPQMLFETGDISYEEIRTHPDRSRLLYALGDPKKTPRTAMTQRYMQLEPNDSFHLSSDGFWEWLLEADMLKMLAVSKNMMLATEMMERSVLKKARALEPDHDNFTALNLRIEQAEFNAAYWHKTRFKS